MIELDIPIFSTYADFYIRILHRLQIPIWRTAQFALLQATQNNWL